jgi:hypothetical protein
LSIVDSLAVARSVEETENGDRGYDHDKYRRPVRALGVRPLIARRGVEHGSGPGTQQPRPEKVDGEGVEVDDAPRTGAGVQAAPGQVDVVHADAARRS